MPCRVEEEEENRDAAKKEDDRQNGIGFLLQNHCMAIQFKPIYFKTKQTKLSQLNPIGVNPRHFIFISCKAPAKRKKHPH